MKKILLFAAALSLGIFSCKKKSGSDDGGGLSQDIKNFVPQSVIDSMRSWGLVINEGKTPPVVNSIFDVSPNVCSFDNSGYNTAGNTYDNYRFRFRDQDNEKLTITLDFKAFSGVDSAAGVGSFIAGNNNDFTVFVNVSGIQYGIAYKEIGFYSGTKTEKGIKNFQFAFYFTEKGDDPGNKLVKVGSSRIFYDTDNLSGFNSVYKILSPNLVKSYNKSTGSAP